MDKKINNRINKDLTKISSEMHKGDVVCNGDIGDIISRSCVENGITPGKVLGAVREALSADIMERDKYGDVVNVGPNHKVRLQAAMIGLELLKFIKGKEVSTGDTNIFQFVNEAKAYLVNNIAINKDGTEVISSDNGDRVDAGDNKVDSGE